MGNWNLGVMWNAIEFGEELIDPIAFFVI